jgi:nicotinamidase-related amidase
VDRVALIVTDMLNPYDHEDADVLADNVAGMVHAVARLVEEAGESDVELVYVNDNYGDFAATRDDLVRRALEGRRPELIEPIVPPGTSRSSRRRATARSTAPRSITCCASDRSTRSCSRVR